MKKYEKQWSSNEPGLMIFLIDQSGSMEVEWGDKNRAEQTSLVVNKVLENIILTNMDGTKPKNRAYISLIGYGGNGGNTVDILAKGLLSDIADNPIDIQKVKVKKPDGGGGIIEIVEEKPVWVTPIANGLTPMGGAMDLAKDIIEKWIGKRADAPAPIIINITDGMAYNGNESNPMEEVEKTISVFKEIQSIKTSLDESPLVFNVHIGGDEKKIGFPENESELGNDDMAKFLFEISSRVPDAIKEGANFSFSIKENSKAFIANADLIDLIEFIEFGSKSAMQDKI